MTSPLAAETIPAIFFNAVTEHGDRAALFCWVGDVFQTRTWNEIAHDVWQCVAVLKRLGLSFGDRVAQVAENRYEWLVADLAILAVGGVHVPIHVTLSERQVVEQIYHSGSRFAIFSAAFRAESWIGLRDRLHGVSCFVYESGASSRGSRDSWQPWHELIAEIDGPAIRETRDQGITEVEPHDLATILYTSGTTGESKGVMLSHANLSSNAAAICQAYGGQQDDVRLSFLPLSHIYARTCDYYTWIYDKSVLALAENRETVLSNCQDIRPTLLNGVPYFYERICHHLELEKLADQPDALVHLLGGAIRLCFSGGAALSRHVLELFERQRVPLLQGYGLSECSPVISFCTLQNNKIGTVGLPVPQVKVCLAEDGEILTKGPHVMLGYWKDLKMTREIIRDGWLHTGDLGSIDEVGRLTISGRKKELIVLATGKNVAPVYLEGLLMSSPWIDQALVIGDGRKFLVALVVPNGEVLQEEMLLRSKPGEPLRKDLCDPVIQKLFRKTIDQQLSSCSRHEQIGRFQLLQRPFSLVRGELTAKMTPRRKAIEKHFAADIVALYCHNKAEVARHDLP